MVIYYNGILNGDYMQPGWLVPITLLIIVFAGASHSLPHPLADEAGDLIDRLARFGQEG